MASSNQISTSPYLLSDANQASYNYGQLPPDQALEEQALNRRQHIANLMIQQGLAQAGANHGQMVGRFYVPGSPLQNLAGLASVAAGAYGTHRNDEARRELTGKSNDILAQAVQAYHAKNAPTELNMGEAEGPGAPVQTATAGEGFTPEELQQPAGGRSTMKEATDALFAQRSPAYFQEGPRPQAGTTVPATPEARKQALVDLMASQHPQAQALGRLLQQQEQHAQEAEANRAVTREGHESNVELRKATIEANALNTQALIDSKERMGQDANALRKQLGDQQAELKRMEIGAHKEALDQGKTPQGYRKTAEGNLEAIPGGPADLKQQGVLNTDTAMLQGSNAAFDRLGASANALLNHPGLAGITGLRGKIPNIPGSAAADAEAQLNTLKSQIGFGVMQELRNNSKSGSSGLGALSDAEGKRLEQNLAALDKAQSIEQMKSSLQSILDYSQGAKDRLRDVFNMKHKNQALQESAAPPVSTMTPGVPQFHDPEKQKRYEEFKKNHTP